MEERLLASFHIDFVMKKKKRRKLIHLHIRVHMNRDSKRLDMTFLTNMADYEENIDHWLLNHFCNDLVQKWFASESNDIL